jgi:hypothetical protein
VNAIRGKVRNSDMILGEELASVIVNMGELMHMETIAFQERYSWSYDKFFWKFKVELEFADYVSRSEILGY